MDEIEVVMKIPKEEYEMIVNSEDCGLHTLTRAVAHGVILPKGHGRLIDGSKLKVELECGIKAGNYEEGYEKYAHINGMDDCIDAVEYADTIIEADKN